MLVRGIALTTIALLWVVALVRLVGLRSFSKMTAFDFVATIATGSLLAAAAAAESWTTFTQILLAMATLLSVQWALARARVASDRMRHLLGNTPVLLMLDGIFCEAAMRRTRVAREDVFAKIRAANALSLASVRAVVLENTGDISVLHGEGFEAEVLEGVKRLRGPGLADLSER